MTTEEKAKAYDEMVQRVKELHEAGNALTKRQMEIICPELAESEDERNWKSVERAIRGFITNPTDVDELLAWLEKQKDSKVVKFDHDREQKPAEWSEKHIADVFEKVGLAKIAREQGNDVLINAVQSAMIELSKVKNAEWSEEDEEMLSSIEQWLHEVEPKYVEKELSWLESLPERFNPQPKQEWSEEDKLMIQCCLQAVKSYGYNAKRGEFLPAQFNIDGYLTTPEKVTDWLKSIRPKPHWKPSEEQMNALNTLNLYGDLTYIGQQNELISLYNDLKKL